MPKHNDDWGFGELFEGVMGFADWGRQHRNRWRGGPRRRAQVFEAGEIRLVILRLLKEQARHGYDIIKALEERMAGCYTPSAGTVYPTLQLLEDQGLVRAEERDGKRVYFITPSGEALLEERRSELDDIIERVKETVRDFTGGAMGDLNRAFGELASRTFREAFRRGPGDPAVRRVADIIRRATEEIEREWHAPATPPAAEGRP